MKLVKRDKSSITMIPQDAEDLYTIYNILEPDDVIIAKTSRKLKKGEGSTNTVRISVKIELKITEVEFHGFGDSLRIRGIIQSCSDENISLGAYHTINLEINKPFTLKKQLSKYQLDTINQAQMGKNTGLVIIVIDDDSALIAQVGSHAYKIIFDGQAPVPRKGSDPNAYETGMNKFFHNIASILNEFRDNINYLVIGGPGFTHDKFYEFMKNNYKQLMNNTINVSIRSSGKAGIKEILLEHIPDNFIEHNTSKLQFELIQQVLEHIGKNTGLVAFGSDIIKAAEIGAVEYLLVLDTLFHETVETRKKLDNLIDIVQNNRGKIVIISSDFEAGDILKGFGKLAAILRFKLIK